MTQPDNRPSAGVTRRQFLKFTGIGLVAGLAAMAMGSRFKKQSQPRQVASLDEDSMFRPREGSRPKS
ncbi:MAG: twin-arginine translocation signal domain-containing protein [Chloroflexi bacterium]|nr:twin-arginine translocation signal domain-containing protein [Chloroflexota bacterium]